MSPTNRSRSKSNSPTQYTHLVHAIKVKPGDKIDLTKVSTNDNGGLEKEEGIALATKLGEELTHLQELMFAANQAPVLIVLQGRDTSGKDGTIRHLLHFLNAQGTLVVPFKVPTAKELAHDFLWRCHRETPGRGETVIFNRSHYEDVLVVRVHALAPENVWKKRYGHINDWEKLLTDSGTIVLKFFLHISKDEQEERLLEREKEVEKSWKLSANDWKEREFWSHYDQAFEDMLSRCSTDAAPWHIIPADRKWFRNLAITEVLVEELRKHKDECMKRLEAIGIEAKEELAAFRGTAS